MAGDRSGPTAEPECPDPEIGRLLGLFDAGTCTEEEREAFAEHLLLCGTCRALEAGTRGGWGAVLSPKPAAAGRILRLRWVAAAAALLGVAAVATWRFSGGPPFEKTLAKYDEADARALRDDWEGALAAIDEALAKASSPSLLSRKGMILREMGRPEKAVIILKEALAEEEPEGAPWRPAPREQIRYQYALALVDCGRLAEAEAAAREPLDLERAWDLFGKTNVYSRLARRCFRDSRDLSEGRRYLALAREVDGEYRALPPEVRGVSPRSPFVLLLEMQVASLLDGDTERLVALGREYLAYCEFRERKLREAAPESKEPDAGALLADGRNSLASALLARFEETRETALLDEAEPLLRDSLEVRRRVRNRRGEVWALTNLGVLSLRREAFDEADQRLAEARSAAASLPDGTEERISIELASGHARLGLRRWDGARDAFDGARGLARVAGHPREEGQALEGLLLSSTGSGSRVDPGMAAQVDAVLLRLADATLARSLRSLAAGTSGTGDVVLASARVAVRPPSPFSAW